MFSSDTPQDTPPNAQSRVCDPVREIWVRVQTGGILYGESLIGISILAPDGTLEDIFAAKPVKIAEVFYRDIPGRDGLSGQFTAEEK